MISDTVFHALSDGEQILGVYRDVNWCNLMETVITLTDTRLLIRWKETFCCCGHQSMYDAITLGSIFRVHDTRYNRFILLFSAMAVTLGLVFTIVGFADVGIWMGIIGILILLLGLGFVIYTVLLLRKKIIWLTGTFGNVSFRLTKTDAREFEHRLCEAMHQNHPARRDGPRSLCKPLARPNDNVSRVARQGKGKISPSPGGLRTSSREEDDA